VDGRPEVVLFTFDAGGGHRAAARALVAAAEQQGAPFRFEVVSLQDVLAPLDLGRRLTGRSMEETYNDMIRRRRTRFLVPMLRVLQWVVRRLRAPLEARVAAYLATRRPAAVLSVIPNFNAILRGAVRRSHPGVPFLVLLTDFCDFPPHFWMERDLDGLIVATSDAAAQAHALGVPAERVFRTSGMVLHPRFYPRAGPERRAAARRELGLGDDDFAVLVIFGGKGSPEMHPLCEALLAASRAWHVIAVCGDNPRLFEGLAAVEAHSGGRLHRLGFSDRVADLLAASDLLVTKPGPGSLAEAFHQHVPVIVSGNGHTIPQERYNVRLVAREVLGVSVHDWREMPAAAAALAADGARLSHMRQNLAALPENRAVYEVLNIVERTVAASPRGLPAA
jgi:UDP-N-acetylglucosamine:LPS N-acetylglucosamine transferase